MTMRLFYWIFSFFIGNVISKSRRTSQKRVIRLTFVVFSFLGILFFLGNFERAKLSIKRQGIFFEGRNIHTFILME